MTISFDPAKRDKTLQERGLDFADAVEVFSGVTFEVEDTRRDYGEVRIICFDSGEPAEFGKIDREDQQG